MISGRTSGIELGSTYYYRRATCSGLECRGDSTGDTYLAVISAAEDDIALVGIYLVAYL